MTRGQQARKLEIESVLADAQQLNMVASAMMLPSNNWAVLRGLKITVTSSYAQTEEFCTAILWLLEHTDKLQFLRLKLTEQLFANLSLHKQLPHLAKLEHLQLSLEDGSLCDLAQSLKALTSLRTLYLEFNRHTSQFDDRPDLDLSGLGKLRSVSLADVVPGSLNLPKGAALHLQMCRLSHLMEDVWKQHAPVLESVYLSVGNGDVIADASQLPKFLVGPSGLKSVILQLTSFGTSEHPIQLSGSFLQVECIILQCFLEVCIRVPAGMLPWRLASFTCTGSLNIAFESVGNFLDCCPAFHFAYGSLRGVNILQLCQLAEGRSIRSESSCEYNHEVERVMGEFYSVCTPDFVRIYYMSWSRNPMCLCGACPTCSSEGSCGSYGLFS